MEISGTYATKETTSRLQAALCWGLTIYIIQSGLRLIPVSSPLEHILIHHVLRQVVQFRQAGCCCYSPFSPCSFQSGSLALRYLSFRTASVGLLHRSDGISVSRVSRANEEMPDIMRRRAAVCTDVEVCIFLDFSLVRAQASTISGS